MPPPPSTRPPPPKTASAKAALANFYCELCSKGYARMNEWEAHEGSYDHQHRKRLKELKAMSRDPGAGERARRAEAKSAGMVSIMPVKIKLGEKTEGVATGKGFKKAGFKSAFGGGSVSVEVAPSMQEGEGVGGSGEGVVLESESEEEDDAYDPRRPTGCAKDCGGRMEVE